MLLHFRLLIVWNGFTWRLVLCRRVSALTTVQARVCRNTRKLFRELGLSYWKGGCQFCLLTTMSFSSDGRWPPLAAVAMAHGFSPSLATRLEKEQEAKAQGEGVEALVRGAGKPRTQRSHRMNAWEWERETERERTTARGRHPSISRSKNAKPDALTLSSCAIFVAGRFVGHLQLSSSKKKHHVWSK